MNFVRIKPSYLMVKEKIELMVEQGEFVIGQMLPSASEMAAKFQVSRETYRAAVKLLEEEGKLFVKHGVGTFIVKPRPEIPSRLDKLQSTGEMIRRAGLKEGERKESISVESCRGEWANMLDIAPGDPVVVLKRIRTADRKAVSYSENIMPKSQVGDVFEKQPFSGSLFEFLYHHLRLNIVNSQTEITVPHIHDANVDFIKTSEESKILLFKQLHFDERNVPVLYSLDYLLNDIFKFVITRKKE